MMARDRPIHQGINALSMGHEEEAKPYLWEEPFNRLVEESWKSEVHALSHSALLQGTVVPKFYGSGVVITQANTCDIQSLTIIVESGAPVGVEGMGVEEPCKNV